MWYQLNKIQNLRLIQSVEAFIYLSSCFDRQFNFVSVHPIYVVYKLAVFNFTHPPSPYGHHNRFFSGVGFKSPTFFSKFTIYYTAP